MYNKHGPIRGRPRGDPPWIFDARGDPPLVKSTRDGPQLLFNVLGHLPALFRAGGEPMKITKTRDGPHGSRLNFSVLAGFFKSDREGIACWVQCSTPAFNHRKDKNVRCPIGGFIPRWWFY